MLMVLDSTAILGSDSRGTHDHILLSHDSGYRAHRFPTFQSQSQSQSQNCFTTGGIPPISSSSRQAP
jgi:hypothetical protein